MQPWIITEFKINTKLYVPIVTLSTKDNVKLTKELNKGFKRSVYWNQHKTEMKRRDLNNNNRLRILLDASFEGVKKLFVLAFDNTDNSNKKVERDSHRKYFLPRVNITNYNVLIGGRTFMISLLKIKPKNMKKLERLQQDKEMIIQHDFCYIIANKKN